MDKNIFSEKTFYNLFDIGKDYITNMIHQVAGIKSIILDKETKTIFSLLTSKSFAIKEEVFMFDEIENHREEKMLTVKGIYFIRPTENNLVFLQKHLQNPMFGDIYLCNCVILIKFFLIMCPRNISGELPS
jgi:hypothetical protein